MNYEVKHKVNWDRIRFYLVSCSEWSSSGSSIRLAAPTPDTSEMRKKNWAGKYDSRKKKLEHKQRDEISALFLFALCSVSVCVCAIFLFIFCFSVCMLCIMSCVYVVCASVFMSLSSLSLFFCYSSVLLLVSINSFL